MKSESPGFAVEKVTLENGLTLLLKEDPRAPIFSLQATVRAGSIYEGERLGTGVSHFLEHVIDDGTTTRSREEIDDLVETLGNVSNAYTARDHTKYVLTASRDHADIAFELFADFLQNPLLPPDDVEVHRGIILNEFNQVADNPDDQLGRAFYETVYRVHPLRVPIEGYREQFETLTREDLLDYHRRTYTPHNIVISVVGDLDMDRVRRRLSELWGRLPPSGWAPPALPDEPPQIAPREIIREGAVELAYGILGYRTVRFPHPDAPALFLLTSILGGSESSLLHRELKEDRELIHGVHAWTELPTSAEGFLGISFSSEPGRQTAIRAALLDVLDRVVAEGPPEGLLETGKAIAEAESLFASQTVEDEAAAIGYHELALGEPNYHRVFLQQLREVTAEEVKAAARRWLREERRTFVALEPKTPRFSNGRRARALRHVPRSAALSPERFVLPNGLRVVVQEDATQPTVFIAALFQGGVYRETARTNGVFHLAAQAALRGTATRDRDAISRAIEMRGGILDAMSGHHSFGFSLNMLSRDLPFGLEILTDVFRHPAFRPTDVARVKRDHLAAIRAQSEDAYDLAYRALLSAFYAHHPYRHMPEGTIESVRALGAEDCRRMFARYARPNNAVLSIVGDVRPSELFDRVARLLNDWQPAPIEPARTLLPRRTREIRVEAQRDMAQAIICIGYPGVDFLHPDADALLVLQAALAGLNYPGGRLYKELRQRQLVYEVNAEHEPGMDTGMFHLYAATTHEQVGEVMTVVDRVVEELKATPLSSDELRRVQEMCIADFFIHLQRNEERAFRMGLDELYGLGHDFAGHFDARIRAITAATVQRVAQQYLRREGRVVSIVAKGPGRATEPVVRNRRRAKSSVSRPQGGLTPARNGTRRTTTEAENPP